MHLLHKDLLKLMEQTSVAKMQRCPVVGAAVTGSSQIWSRQQPHLVQSLKVIPGDFQWRKRQAIMSHRGSTVRFNNLPCGKRGDSFSVRGLVADSHISDANLLALMVITCQHPPTLPPPQGGGRGRTLTVIQNRQLPRRCLLHLIRGKTRASFAAAACGKEAKARYGRYMRGITKQSG